LPNHIETATEGWNVKPWGTEEDDLTTTFEQSNDKTNQITKGNG